MNDNNKEETTQKPTQKPIKLSKLDKAILTTLKAHPNLNKAQLAKAVVDLGVTAHIHSVYNRLKKKDYLQREMTEIENHLQEQLVREDYPLARKRLVKALKDKDITHKEALPYVKLVYDKTHGEKYINKSPEVVHIGAIKNAQFVIQSDLQDETLDNVSSK